MRNFWTLPTLLAPFARVRPADQVVFAEALSQLLAAGVELSHAIVAAADATPARRFRRALRAMAAAHRAGTDLERSLTRTGVRVSDRLLAALAVGEERGRLPELLAEFARTLDPRPGRRLAAAVGRPLEAARFAAALAGLMADRPLSPRLVEDAGRLAGRGARAAAEQVAEALRDGQPLAEALAFAPATFDPLFRLLVTTPVHREHVRSVLVRLGADAFA